MGGLAKKHICGHSDAQQFMPAFQGKLDPEDLLAALFRGLDIPRREFAIGSDERDSSRKEAIAKAIERGIATIPTTTAGTSE